MGQSFNNTEDELTLSDQVAVDNFFAQLSSSGANNSDLFHHVGSSSTSLSNSASYHDGVSSLMPLANEDMASVLADMMNSQSSSDPASTLMDSSLPERFSQLPDLTQQLSINSYQSDYLASPSGTGSHYDSSGYQMSQQEANQLISTDELIAMIDNFQSGASDAVSIKSPGSDLTSPLGEFDFNSMLPDFEHRSPSGEKTQATVSYETPSVRSPPGKFDSGVLQTGSVSSRKIRRPKTSTGLSPNPDNLTNSFNSSEDASPLLAVAQTMDPFEASLAAITQVENIPVLSIKSVREDKSDADTFNPPKRVVLKSQSSQENQMIPKTRRVSKAKKVISEKQTKRRYQREELIDIAKRDGERCGYCWKSPSFDLLTTDLIDILEAGLRLENVAKEPLNVTTQEFKEYQEPRKEPFVDYLYQV